MHLKKIYAEGELVEEGICKDFLQVQPLFAQSIPNLFEHLFTRNCLYRA